MQWMRACNKTHAKCARQSLTTFSRELDDKPPLLPTRVLEIREQRNIKLHVSGETNARGVYACLSHCWGGIVPLRTMSNNIQTFQEDGIAWDVLPKTFQNALEITFQLGLKYLWIDSLCIIQDDLQDWRHEGSRMSDIYSGAYITLAAVSASTSHEGFIHDLHSPREPTRLTMVSHEGDGALYNVLLRYVGEMAEDDLDKSLPLLRRSWVFDTLSVHTSEYSESNC